MASADSGSAVRAVEAVPSPLDDRHVLSQAPKVYIYDFCPFCTRVRMLFGLKNIKYTPMFLESDDFDTPVRLVGKKSLPILEYNDAGVVKVMPESMDIVRHVDEHFGGGPAMLSEAKLESFTSKVFPNKDFITAWVIRVPEMSNLAEFQTRQARKCFRANHKLEGGTLSWEEARATDQARVKRLQEEWVPLIEEGFAAVAQNSGPYLNGEFPSYDDIVLFPFLRCATVIKSLTLGQRAAEYVRRLSEIANVPLFYPVAPF